MERSKESLRALKTGSVTVEAFFETVCREITEEVGSTRASVWTFVGPLRDAIVCERLVDTREIPVQSGLVLHADDFPEYFAEITHAMRVVAQDARSHPATRAFNEVFFAPLDIRSLLDFVILAGDRPAALLCCEHCGEQKQWTQRDIDYLQAMSTLVMFGLKYASRAPA